MISASHGCADDVDEALALYEVRLDEITRDARCAVKRYEPACRDLHERCSR